VREDRRGSLYAQLKSAFCEPRARASLVLTRRVARAGWFIGGYSDGVLEEGAGSVWFNHVLVGRVRTRPWVRARPWAPVVFFLFFFFSLGRSHRAVLRSTAATPALCSLRPFFVNKNKPSPIRWLLHYKNTELSTIKITNLESPNQQC
jgi:hypothetical protein